MSDPKNSTRQGTQTLRLADLLPRDQVTGAGARRPVVFGAPVPPSERSTSRHHEENR